jgi:hypothetical protein
MNLWMTTSGIVYRIYRGYLEARVVVMPSKSIAGIVSFRPAANSSVQSWSQSNVSYLVDPASSHMLVSKIKPCMSKYKLVCTV